MSWTTLKIIKWNNSWHFSYSFYSQEEWVQFFPSNPNFLRPATLSHCLGLRVTISGKDCIRSLNFGSAVTTTHFPLCIESLSKASAHITSAVVIIVDFVWQTENESPLSTGKGASSNNKVQCWRFFSWANSFAKSLRIKGDVSDGSPSFRVMKRLRDWVTN
jgi:hypothetical protein